MARKLAKKQPEVFRYEELEQRVLFSADLVPGLDTDTDTVYEQVLVEDIAGAAQTDTSIADNPAVQVDETRHELVFVNDNVANYEQLIADLQGDDNRTIEVVVLDSSRDGIEQVSGILSERTNLSAIHFITHGSDGQINIGDGWLNSTTLAENSAAVSGWGNALTETGDILFYGCNIAADSAGQTLLDDIADLTSADVAASDDLTGNAEKGGDWDLEYREGTIDTTIVVAESSREEWAGVLPPTNDPPVITLPGAEVNYSENDSATVIDAGATVIDTDNSNFDGGTLTVYFTENGTNNDRLAIRNQGIDSEEIGVYASNVTYENKVIGTFIGGTDGSTPLVITFNSTTYSTPAAAAALMQNITYENMSENPSTSARTVQFVLTDGDGGTSNAVTKTINVSTLNDAPVNTVPGTQATLPDTPLVFSSVNDNAITVSDIDAVGNPINMTLGVNNGSLSLSDVTGTLSEINALLDGLTYTPNASYTGIDTLTITTYGEGYTEGDTAQQDIDAIQIEVMLPNTAPNFSSTLDGTPTFVEEGTAVVLDTDVDISDDELDVLNGGLGNYAGASLTLVRNGGDSADDAFAFNDGNGITFSGGNLIKNAQIIAGFDTTTTPGELVVNFSDTDGEIPTSVDLDNILQQITYANSSDNPPASAQIDWTFDDGNTGDQGSGGTLTATGSTTVTIDATNDAPENTVPGVQETAENTALVFSTDIGNPISTSDPDANDEEVKVTLSVTNGTLTLPSGPSDETLVNTTVTGTQSYSDIAVAADGSFVVTWTDYALDGDFAGIFMQRFAADGTAIGSETQVNTYTINNQDSSAVAMDDAGNFVVTWESYGQDGDTEGIYAQRFNSAGVKQGSEFHVSTYTASSQSNPDVAMHPTSGDFTITWEDNEVDGIYMKRFASDGTVLIDDTAVTTGIAYSAAIATSESGDTVIVWHANVLGTYDVWGQRYDEFGAAVGGSFLINTYDDSTQNLANVAMDKLGNFVVVWESYGQDGSYDGIYAQRYDSDGVKQGSEFLVNTQVTLVNQTNPTVAMEPGGDFVIAWECGQLDGSNYGIAAKKYDSDGNVLTEDFLVNSSTDENQLSPAVSSCDKGFVISWHGGGDTEDGVFFRTYFESGLTFSEGDGVDDATMTFTGTIADINTALDGLIYTPNPAYIGPDILEITTDDQGFTGSDGTLNDYDTVAINVVSGLSTPPVVTLPGSAVNYAPNDPAVIIDDQATVTDSDSSDFENGTLTVDFTAGATVNDRLAIHSEGTDVGQISIDKTINDGWIVKYGGTTIGTFTGGIYGFTPLVITLNASADVAATQALLRNITYENVSDTPDATARTVRFVLADGDGGTSAAVTETINITAANTAPVITSNGGGATAAINVAENTDAVTIVTATDADLDTLTYSLDLASDDDGFFTIDSGTGELTFAVAPDFETPADLNGDNVYEVTVNVDDGNGGTDSQAISVTVTNINEGPDQNIPMYENAILVASMGAGDSDVPPYGIDGGDDAALFQVIHSPGSPGTFYLLFNDAPNFEIPTDSNGDNVYEVTVNFNDVHYNYFITVNDLNDAPTLTASPINPTYTENGAAVQIFGFATADLIESGQTLEELVFTVTNVTDGNSELITLDGSTFALADLISGTTTTNSYGYSVSLVGSTATVTLTTTGATVANIANLIGSINYENSSESPSTPDRVFTITSITDSGGTLNGGIDTTSLNLVSTVTVVAVNDAPELSGADNLAAIDEDPASNEVGTLVSVLISGQVTDADTGALSGIAVTAVDDTNGTWEYTTDGTNWFAFGAVDVANALLLASDDSVRFVPDPDWNGTVTDGITFHAWDQTSGVAGTIIDLTNLTFLDQFNTVSYSNNDGNASWTGDWTEIGDDDNAATGDLRIDDVNGTLHMDDIIDGGGGIESIFARTFDLSNATSATLTFDYSGYAFGGADSFAIELSDNGGADWTRLEDFSYAATDFSSTRSYDLTDYVGLTADMEVRFIITDGFGGPDQYVSFDNIKITTNEVGTGGVTSISTDTASSSITVNAVNDLPSGSVTIDDITPTEGQLLTASNSLADADGLGAITYTWKADGSVVGTGTTYTTTQSDVGTEITVEASYTDADGSSELVSSAATALVTNVDQAAVISGDTSYSGNEGDTATGTLTASDADGLTDGTIFSVTGAATSGSASINAASGLWSYTPNADFNGSDSFTVTVTDDAGNTATQLISLTVTAVADIAADTDSTIEDTAVTSNLLSNDSFAGTPTITAVTQGTDGTVAIVDANSGTVSYTPDANFSGTDSYTYTVTSGGVTETATVTVTVNPVNDPTSFGGDISGSGAEDGAAISGTLTASDADGLTDGTIFSVTGAATSGSASINAASGLWSYTPNADFNGSDSFTVTVTDDAGNTATQLISLTVTAVADIAADTDSTIEDTAVTSNLLSNDSFAGTPTITAVTQGTDGTVAIVDANSGTVSYTPDANFSGTDSYTYTVTSGGVTETATVTVTVNPVNDPTSFGGDISGSGAEDGAAISGTLTASDADGLTDGTIFSVTGAATSGSASINAASGLWSYTPNADFNGSDSFTVTVTDDAGNTATQLISLTVTAVADIAADTDSTIEDTAVTSNLLSNDSFAGTPTITAVTQGTDGTVAIVDANSGTVSYTPDANFSGTDSYTYTVTSGGVTETATVTVTVNPVNDPTSFGGDISGSGAEDGAAISGTLTASDADGLTDGTIFSVTGAATSGSASINAASGLWSYTPNADFNGSDSFTVTVTDDAGNTATQLISLTVTAVADIAADTDSTIEDTAVTSNLLSNDSFAGTPTITAVTQGTDGTVAIVDANSGTVSYTPDANFSGTDSYTYTVTSGGVTETATVTVTVNPVNDPTSFGGDISGSGAEDGAAISGTLTASDADGLTDGTIFSVTGAATSGSASINAASGLWSYTPNADFNGSDSFTVTVTDDAGNTATQLISLTVTAVADIAADTDSTIEDTAVTSNLLSNDSFAGTPTITAVTQGTDGTVAIVDANSGTVSYTPDANFSGTDSYTYTVTSGGVTETATVTVTVNPVNDPTSFGGDISGSGAEDGAAISGTLTASDADGLTDGTIFSVTGAATSGSASINAASGLWSYTPNADFNGSDSFTVTVTDDAGNTATQLISLTVTAVADIAADTDSTIEDTAVTSNLLSNDSFAGTPTITAVTQGTDGTVAIVDANSGTVSYTPDANFSGTDSYTYTVTSGGVTETATVTVTVNPVNDPTSFGGDISGSGAEDGAAISGTLTASDADGLTDGTIFSVTGAATSGSASINAASGLWSYTPNADFNGSDSFTVTVTDDAGNTATQLISLTVTAVADIAADTDSTIEDTAVTSNLLSNDSFAGTPTITAVTQGTDGTVAIVDANSGTVSYTPDANFSGTDSYTYTVTSGGVTETATVTVTVNPVNDPTSFGGDISGSGAEDGAAISGTLTASDADGLTDGTIFSVTGAATSGSASINAASGLWSYTPNADFNGSDSFTVTVTDDAGNTATQLISLTVTAVADIAADTDSTIEDTAVTSNLLSNDSFAGTPTITAVTQGTDGTVAIVDANSGTVSYTPDANFSGTDSYTYTVTSGGVTETATVTVTVNPVNDPTSFGGDISGSGAEDGAAISGTLTASDADGLTDGTIFSVTGAATSGSASINAASGLWSYTPNADFNGSDSFTVTVTDDAGNTATQLISLTVTAVADIAADTDSTIEDTAVTSNLLSNDSFAGTPTITAVTQGTDGTVAIVDANSGTVSYTPDANFSGTDSYTYTVTSGGVTETATVTVTVNPVNDPTSFGGDISGSGAEDGAAISGTLTASDADGLTDGTIFSVTGAATSGSASINAASGLWSYTPNADFNGSDSFTVTVTDDAGNTATQLISLTVTAVNDAPVAADDTYNVNEGSGGFLPPMGVLLNDSDVDSGALTATQVSNVTHGTLTLNVNGSWWYSPDPDYYGTDSFTYKVNDGFLDSNIATVTFNIAPRNDAPTGNDNTITTLEDTDYTFSSSDFGFSDPVEGDALLAVTISSLPSSGTLTLVGSGAVSAGDLISLSDIDANRLVFIPVADANGAGYASFTFQVQDDGGTLNGGIDTDQSPNNMTIDVTPVNDDSVVDLNGPDGGGINFVTTFTENGGAVSVTDTDATLSDVDNTTYNSLVLNFPTFFDGVSEQITIGGYMFTAGTSDTVNLIVGSTDFSVVFNGSNFGITRNGGGSIPQADLQDLVRGMTYENISEAPTAGDRLFVIYAIDADDKAGQFSVSTITVIPVNDAPVITAAQTFSLSELAANGFSLGTVVATDVDTVTTLSGWTITGGNTDNIFAINAATGEITVLNNTNLDFDTTPSYTLSLSVSDGTNTSAIETVTITVADVSTAITASQSFSVAETAADGTVVDSVVTTGDTPQTFAITAGNTGSAFAIDNSGNITVADTSVIDYETLTSYTLTVQTSDGTTPVSANVTITVTDVNENVVGAISDVDATANSVAEDGGVGDTVGITASATDPDGSDSVTYSLSDDASGLFAIDTNTGVVTVNGVLDAETATDHSITVVATSSDTSTSNLSYTIAVTDVDEFNVGPVTDADATVNTVAEDAGIGTAVHITATASDADVTDDISYSLSVDAGGLFSIDGTTGIVTIANVLDYESATSHSITVLATSDDGSTSNAVFTIDVTDVNDNAPVITAAQFFSVSESAANGVSLGSAVATDVDTGTTLSAWTITGGNTDNVFTIDTASGEITVLDNSDLDFDTTDAYTLSLTVSDGTNTSAIETVTITVTDVATAITASQSFSIAETAADGTVVGSVVTTGDTPQTFAITAGNTGSAFAIDNSGNITVADTSVIDYETLTSYTLTVQTSDGTTPVSANVTITVTDVNENVVGAISDVDATANAVNENAIAGTTVGVTSSATDPDAADTVSYSLDDDAGGLFTINSNTGVVTVAGALDAETATSHNITIRATSSDASFDTMNLSISVTDVNEFNVGPVTDSNGIANTVAEDATAGTVVGISALATDADVTDNVAYSLTDNAGGRFAIDANSGVITVNDALDYEQNTSHSVTATATSSDGSTSQQIFAISVTDINEDTTDDGTTTTTDPPIEDPDPIDEISPDDPPPDPEDTIEDPLLDEEIPEFEEITIIPDLTETDDLPAIEEEYAAMELNDETRESVKELKSGTQHQRPENDRSYSYFDNNLYKEILSDNHLGLQHQPPEKVLNLDEFDDFGHIDFESDNLDRIVANGDYDLIREEIDEAFNEQVKADAVKTKVATITSATFTVGIISYLLRAGSLAASLASSLPLWRGFDPIIVFSGDKKKQQEQNKLHDTEELTSDTIFEDDTE